MTRVVLVTGANRGIGRELASQLVVRGDTVVLTARDLAKAERTAATLPDPRRVLARQLDVTDPATIAQVAADLDRRHGRLDVLVNAVCPGWVATDMGGPGGRPVAAGAASVLWAVDLPDDGPTGGFYATAAPSPGDAHLFRNPTGTGGKVPLPMGPWTLVGWYRWREAGIETTERSAVAAGCKASGAATRGGHDEGPGDGGDQARRNRRNRPGDRGCAPRPGSGPDSRPT